MRKNSLTTCVVLLLMNCGSELHGQSNSYANTIYIQNAIMGLRENKDFGKIFVLSVLNDRFKQSANFSADDRQRLQQYANSENDKVKQVSLVAASASNYSFYKGTRETAKSLLAIAGAFAPGSGTAKKVTAVASELLNLGGRAAEYYFGPGEQVKAQGTVSGQVTYFNGYARDVLNQALANARSNPEFAQMINELYSGSFFGALVSSSPQQILEGNPTLRNSVTLQKILALAQDGNVSDEELIGLLKETNSFVKEQLGPMKELLEDVARISNGTNRQRELAAKQEEIKSDCENARAAVFIAQTFISYYNPRLANYLNVTGNSFVKIYESIASYSTGEGISSLVMSANVLGAINSLLSLAMDRPSDLEIMLDETRKIREDIHNLQERMDDHFRDVDVKLNFIYSTLVNSIDQLNQLLQGFSFNSAASFRELEIQVSLVRSEISSLRASLERQNQDLYYYLSVAAGRTLETDKSECLDFKAEFPNETMAFNQFSSCIGRFKTWANRFAVDGLSVGSASFTTSDNDIYKRLTQYPFENNLGYLALVSSQRFGLASVSRYQNIGNPIIWYMGASSYVEMLETWTEYESRVSPNTVQRALIPDGVNYLNYNRDFLFRLSATGRSVNREFFDAILSNYEAKSQNVTNQIEKIKRNFLQSKLDGQFIDLWGGIDQSARFGLSLNKFSPCDKSATENGSSYPNLPIAPDLPRILSNTTINSELLKLGKVNVCYSPKVTDQKLEIMLKVFFEFDQPDRPALMLYEKATIVPPVTTPLAAIIPNILGNWENGLNLKTKIFNPLLPGRYTFYTHAELDAEAELALMELGEAFQSEVLKEARIEGSALKVSLENLTGAKKLIECILYASLPETIMANEELRGGIYGESSIFDGEDVTSYLAEASTSGITVKHLPDQMRKRLENLRTSVGTTLNLFAGDSPPEEGFSTIRDLTVRLDALQQRLSQP